MSMQIFEESGVFDPTFWNLKIGDILQVIAVGGGGGGGAGVDQSGKHNTSGGDAGDSGYGKYNEQAGGGGGGYGGGGGGGIGYYGGGGGGGGYLKTATIKLASLDPIAVTVGKGGKGGYDNNHLDGENGEASSFGSYVVAEGGGGGKAGTSDPRYGGHGGTDGGLSKGSQNRGAGGGGGGYLIGCNIRGNGGYGRPDQSPIFTNSNACPANITYGNAIGLGGAGGAGNSDWWEAPEPGSLGGGMFGQTAGPGSGVVVVTW